MSGKYEYIISLTDQVSGKIQKITGASTETADKFNHMRAAQEKLDRTTKDFGRSISTLRDKMRLLQAERELINPNDLNTLKTYNKEINKLGKEIDKLENVRGGKFKMWMSDAFSSLPGVVTNPLVLAGAGIAAGAKSAMSFESGMGKINATAQYNPKELDVLSGKLKAIVKDNKAALGSAPDAFEKILSQVGDVNQSLSIFDAALKGAKAGSTDMNVVAGALAQSLSIIGKENTNAQEVLDTLFAAKRVGAGEFADFARYMPNLIAGGSNLGIAFKEVAGVFAYMTGKGQSAERAAVLMENAFGALGKSDIRDKLKKAGVDVFDDTGKIRSFVDIFGDLNKVLAPLNDEQKSNVLQSIGLVDKEAKNAFAILTADVMKLADSLSATSNAAGETMRTLLASDNTMNKLHGTWNLLGYVAEDFGSVFLPIVNVGIDALAMVLYGVGSSLEWIIGLFGSWWTHLQEGTPWVIALTTTLTAFGAILAINTALKHKDVIATKAKTLWDSVLAVKTHIATTAQWAFNTAIYACPLAWIVLAIGAVVTAIVYAWNKFEGFREVIMGTWEVIKSFGKSLFDSIVTPFKKIISGISGVATAIGHLFKGNFKEAADAAKKGFSEIGHGMVEGSVVGVIYNAHQKTDYSSAWQKGKQAGRDSWAASQATSTEDGVPGSVIDKVASVAGGKTFESLMASLGGKKGTGSGGKVIDLGNVVANKHNSSDYAGIVNRLNPKVYMPSLARAAAAVALPLSVATAGTPQTFDSLDRPDDKNVRMERFCDQIVINIAHADGKGADEIKNYVIDTLKEFMDA
ncbi:MAG: phage tail tape measure protein [Marinifilaceae bacterium]